MNRRSKVGINKLVVHAPVFSIPTTPFFTHVFMSLNHPCYEKTLVLWCELRCYICLLINDYHQRIAHPSAVYIPFLMLPVKVISHQPLRVPHRAN